MSKFDVADIMQGYSQDAVDMAYERFHVNLDFSEDSLELVEKILSTLHEILLKDKEESSESAPSQDQIWGMAKMWGGYVGEVIKRRWGGKWTTGRKKFSNETISLYTRDTIIFPPTKVYQRIVNGPEDNIWDYYRVLKQEFE